MTIKVQIFEESIKKIKGRLKDYLDLQGQDFFGNRYVCINPDHADKHPSASIYTDDNGGEHLKCFSCGHTSDIFAAAHILENLPVSGTGFFSETVPYLAGLFNIEVPEYVISDSEREEILMLRLYADAAEYITTYDPENIPQKILSEFERRGWNDHDKNKAYGLGFVNSYDDFRSYLKSKGHTVKAIEDSGLSDPYVFNDNRLLFVFKDEHSRPVGFIGRNLNFNPNKDPETGAYLNGPKYVFNKNPSNGVKLLKKDHRLYLFDRARKTNSNSVYIVEGQPDSLSFHFNGYDNFVSLSGVSMSLEHFELFRRFGIYDVVICFDNDSPGQKAAEKLVETVLKHVNDIRVRFMFLPMVDGNKIDPDLMARNGKFDEFFDLPKINPFDFTLNKIINDYNEQDPEFICNKVLPSIISDPSSIRRETMITTLSSVTGVSERALKDEVKRLIENKGQKTVKLKNDIVGRLASKLSGVNAVEAESMLSETIETLRQIDKESSTEVLDPKSLLGTLLEIKRYEEGDILNSFIRVDPNLEIFMKAMEGDLSQKLVLVPASANVGKTALFVNLIHSIVKNNPQYIVGFLSIDDSLKELVPRFVCYNIVDRNGIDSFAGQNYTINHFSTPTMYKSYPFYGDMMNERTIAFKEIGSWVNEGRLVLLDSESGRSFEFMSSSIRNIREKHPNKKIVFFLDNLHLLTSEGWSETGFDRIKKLSHETKALCVNANCTIISTVELRKLQKGQKADNNDLAGSASLAYDANAIAILSSELDVDPSSNKFFKHGYSGRKNPIIECNFSKNKIASFKGITYAKLYAAQAYYKFINDREFQALYGDTEAEEYANSLTGE